jgi:hypothetical protein
MTMDLAHRRYRNRTIAFMVPYALINMAAIGGAFDDRTVPGSWLLGLAVAAPVIGQLWATLALMHDADEFVRALTAKRFILAAGGAMAIFTAWGFVEEYAHAPHVPGYWVYMLFWACYAVITPFVRTTR